MPFDLTQAVVLEDIKAEKITVKNFPLIPMEAVVQDMPAITLSDTEVKRLSQGQRLSLYKLEIPQDITQDGIYRATNAGKTCGLVRVSGAIISPEFIWLM